MPKAGARRKFDQLEEGPATPEMHTKGRRLHAEHTPLVHTYAESELEPIRHLSLTADEAGTSASSEAGSTHDSTGAEVAAQEQYQSQADAVCQRMLGAMNEADQIQYWNEYCAQARTHLDEDMPDTQNAQLQLGMKTGVFGLVWLYLRLRRSLEIPLIREIADLLAMPSHGASTTQNVQVQDQIDERIEYYVEQVDRILREDCVELWARLLHFVRPYADGHQVAMLAGFAQLTAGQVRNKLNMFRKRHWVQEWNSAGLRAPPSRHQ